MGKTLDWVREEATGRLIFRRRYPDDVRPFLPKPGQRELKVPLGSSKVMTAAAFQRYEQAKRRFDREVKEGRAALQLHQKAAGGLKDALSPQRVAELAEVFLRDWHEYDEKSLRARGEEWVQKSKAAWDELLSEFRAWRASGDTASMEGHWGRTADALLADQGILPDPEDHAGRERLVWALNDVALEYQPEADTRLAGGIVKAPPKPERPANPKGRARTVTSLLDAYNAAKWAGWSQSSRKAISPVFRLLRETIGDQEVQSVDRVTAREVFEMAQMLPMNMGRKAVFQGLTVPQAIEEGKRRGLPVIGPNTVNKAYMVQIAAVFNWAVEEDWALKNPFTGLSMDDPVDDRDRRDAFTLPQLCTLFTQAPWDNRPDNAIAKPGRYWVPLIALLTGMRLGEIAGLRVMDIEDLEGVSAFRVRPHDGRGLKNKESRRDLPIHSELVRLGFPAFVAHRREVASPDDLLFPDGKANSRGQSGPKLGEWFSKHLKDSGIVGTKLGMHSFRHNFEDRLRVAGLHGRPEGQALAGRKVSGSEASYGGAYAIGQLQEALENVTYPGLDLTHLRP